MMSSKPRKHAPMTKQERERHYFEMFRKAYTLPAGTVEYRDRPDVVIDGPRSIGFEITNFYASEGENPGSEQVQRIRRKAVVSLAQTLYLKTGGANNVITFGFDKGHPLQDMPGVAAQIAAMAHRIEGLGNGQIRRDHFRDIPELDFVYLYARELQYSDELDPDFPSGQPDASEHFTAFAEYRNRRDARALREGVYKPLPFTGKWRLTQTHNFGLMSKARLTEIIREKEVKARLYAPCDAFWRLIVVDFMDPAQEQEIRVDGLMIASNVFQRIIVYKPSFEHVVEITPQAARES
jgi:hypothetical protein